MKISVHFLQVNLKVPIVLSYHKQTLLIINDGYGRIWHDENPCDINNQNYSVIQLSKTNISAAIYDGYNQFSQFAYTPDFASWPYQNTLLYYIQ